MVFDVNSTTAAEISQVENDIPLHYDKLGNRGYNLL